MDSGQYIKLVTDYCDYKFGKTKTGLNYSCALKMFFAKHESYSHLKDISDDKILEYLLSISGRSNRCTHHSALKLLMKLTGHKHKMRYIPYPDKEDKLPVHVNKEEFMKMIAVCTNQKHKALICIMFDAGLRVSEIVSLKIADIDESNMMLNVLHAKGRKDRKVKMSKVLLMVISSYRHEYRPQEYLFNGQNGALQYSTRSCEEVVKQLTAKAGIEKNFSPHKFRHGYGMTLIENGVDVERIANQMGHNSTKTTKIYARMNGRVIQSIQSPLEQIVQQAKENTLIQASK